MDTTAPLKPPLKWAGGKRWLVPMLRPVWQRHQGRRLVEPFCGGLAVSLGLQPTHALLNDQNVHLINFYQWLQRGLRLAQVDLCNDPAIYYAHRTEFNRLVAEGQTTSERAAALFYYLNRTGFNGLCRFNQRDQFNVPFGRHRTIRYVSDFSAYQQIFGAWSLSAIDFQMLSTTENDFIYADPPYDVEFRQYSKDGFSWDDQVRLAHWLARQRGAVIASNQATPRILELYSSLGFEIELVRAPRRISCTGDRSAATEMLARRNV